MIPPPLPTPPAWRRRSSSWREARSTRVREDWRHRSCSSGCNRPMLNLAPRRLPQTLPAELRATRPAEMRGLRRDHVRLMVVDRARREITHSRFDHLGEFLREGDLLVLNSSRTLPAALPATRPDGSVVQIRPCVRRPGSWDALAV